MECNQCLLNIKVLPDESWINTLFGCKMHQVIHVISSKCIPNSILILIETAFLLHAKGVESFVDCMDD